jgi:Zn-finger nucleic acid-binding protein
MNCLKCGNVMREREREIGAGSSRELVVIDVCPNCGGIWLDRGELEKLTDFERRHDGGPRGDRRDRRDDDDDGDDEDGGGRQGLFGRIFDGLGNFGD